MGGRKMVRIAMLAGAALLTAAGTLGAQDRAIAGGTSRLIAECAPPDLAGFPAGTFRVDVETVQIAGKTPKRLSWEFRRDEGGFLRVEDGDADRIDPGEAGGFSFPGGTPSDDPLAAMRDLLAAARRVDHAAARSLCSDDLFEDVEKTGEFLARLERPLRRAGLERHAVLEDFLPRAASPVKCVAWLDLRFDFAAPAPGSGTFRVEIRLRFAPGPSPRWIVQEFDFDWKKSDAPEDPPAAGTRKTVGLREAFAPFLPPDLGRFPAGTSEIELTFHRAIGERVFEVRAQFECRPEKGDRALFLEDFRVRSEKKLPKETVRPTRTPREGPFESMRNALEAFLEDAPDEMLPYIASGEKERFLEDLREKGWDRFREEMDHYVEKKGYHPFAVIAGNLPEVFWMASDIPHLKIRYRFPGTVKGEAGTFRPELEFFVESAEADNWTLGEVEIRFHED